MDIRWKRQWGRTDEIVWIDVRKLDAAWKKDKAYYVARRAAGDKDSREKYARFGAWLFKHHKGAQIEMPHVSVCKGVVAFTDGRHRFAWCRDHGVRCLPVTVTTREDARRLQSLYGAGFPRRGAIRSRADDSV